MTKKQKYKSDALESVHSSAKALFNIGSINQSKMRQYDEACLLPPSQIDPAQIKKIRELNKVSQTAFARHLNVSRSTVQMWESGATRPSGMAQKLLAVVNKHGLKVLA